MVKVSNYTACMLIIALRFHYTVDYTILAVVSFVCIVVLWQIIGISLFDKKNAYDNSCKCVYST